jgi:hypothetical protein
MALSNGTGGYQIGAGASGEPLLFQQGTPTAVAAAAVMTAAQLLNGMFVFDGAAGNLQLPTVANVENALPSAARVGMAFDFVIANIDGGADDVTLTVNTGWTLVGVGQVDNATSAIFRALKTGDGTWSVYRIS